MAARGEAYPNQAALTIAGVLLIWALYALSGAGVIRLLPLTRLALLLIAGIYLLRAAAAVVLVPYFPGNSATFWVVSSAVCLLFGLLHALGVKRRWRVWGAKADAA
nr:hypothetical protein [Tahibacter caeni]